MQDPGTHRRVQVLGADDVADHLERGLLPLGERLPHLADQLLDLAPRLGDLGGGIAEGTAVAGQAEVDGKRLDLVEAAEELADRVGGVAVVEEEDRAAQQVVAGDHQLALGLVQDDVRGRVSRRLVDLPGAEVRLDLDPRQQVAVGLDDGVDAVVVVPAAGLSVALQRRGGHAALPRHLEALLQRRRRVVGEQSHVFPGRVHPELAAGALDDRRRQAVVVGVGVGADEQPHVLEPEARLGEGEVELAHPPLATDAGVEEDDSAVGGERPDVAVRHPRPGKRQSQAPDAGQDLLGAGRLWALALVRHRRSTLSRRRV
jgi:hypothetical protein